MKFLILGADGMAGHTITLYLTEQGHDVTAFTTTARPLYAKNIVGNALDAPAFAEMLCGAECDVVINCIGLLNQQAEDRPAMAVYLNSYLPHRVAELLDGTPARLIHMSTDCVFSGKRGRYTEDSFRDGETFYDRSKALGEVEDSRNLTFRNSIIGPDINEQGIGLFNWFMKQSGTIKGYRRAIWTGVTTLTLARAMERAAAEGLSGLYNLVNNETISKYELCRLFNKHFRGGALDIVPDDAVTADKSLYRTRTDFSFAVPSYEDMVADMKRWVDAHPALYPHYA